MHGFKTIAGAALIAASAIATPALAEGENSAVQPEVLQFDENHNVIVKGRPLGGGTAWIVGSGDDHRLIYADTPVLTQSPMVATMTGSGDDWTITYQAPSGGSRLAVGAAPVAGPRG